MGMIEVIRPIESYSFELILKESPGQCMMNIEPISMAEIENMLGNILRKFDKNVYKLEENGLNLKNADFGYNCVKEKKVITKDLILIDTLLNLNSNLINLNQIVPIFKKLSAEEDISNAINAVKDAEIKAAKLAKFIGKKYIRTLHIDDDTEQAQLYSIYDDGILKEDNYWNRSNSGHIIDFDYLDLYPELMETSTYSMYISCEIGD
jgi:hypothetical protein